MRDYGLSPAQQDEIWRRWRDGQSFGLIGRALGAPMQYARRFLYQSGGVRLTPGELLSTVKFMVQTLAAGEFQRELQRELIYDGLRAAEAKGRKGGRRPAVPAAKTESVRTSYLEGRSIAALARDHGVSRGAIRTAVADLLPEHTAADPVTPAPELSSTCRARWPASSAPPSWSPPSAPRSTRA